MKVSKEQVARNKEALLEAAGRFLHARGLAGCGVAEICHEAGLTHGAFYRHFDSKEQLVAQACARAFEWKPAAGRDARAAGDLKARIATYLSAKHRDSLDAGCPVAALAAEAAREGGEVADTFALGVEDYIAQFAALLEQSGGGGTASQREQQAIVTLATMVGGLILARATAAAKPRLSDKILSLLKRTLVRPMQ
jgi:TetR/AcrR family transcriptional regulator, transcriptional repressor for nem operon